MFTEQTQYKMLFWGLYFKRLKSCCHLYKYIYLPCFFAIILLDIIYCWIYLNPIQYTCRVYNVTVLDDWMRLNRQNSTTILTEHLYTKLNKELFSALGFRLNIVLMHLSNFTFFAHQKCLQITVLFFKYKIIINYNNLSLENNILQNLKLYKWLIKKKSQFC